MSDNLQLILRAVQEFDISVSRATELIEIDQEGKFNYDLLPYGAGTQAIFGLDEVPVQKYKEVLAERNALAAKLVELEGQEPVAWARKWFIEGEPPKKEKNSAGRWVWPTRFKFLPVSEGKCMKSDLPLYARPAPAEPVNVDFGMRGENMFFQIGNQSFLLDYKPEEQGEFEFMKAMLLSAFSRISHGVKTESRPVNARLLEAIKRLSFCAQTTGGTAGRDEGLCAAIGEAEKAIAAAESAPKAVRLTDEEVNVAYFEAMKQHVRPQDANAVWRVVRRAESAVLAKNGIEVAE